MNTSPPTHLPTSSMVTSDLTLSIIQINLRHSKLASAALSQLLLGLNIDIALIQEPYASNNTEAIPNVPLGYQAFHALSSDHAYGAVILSKSCLRAKLHPCSSNELAVIRVDTIASSSLSTISLYVRPIRRDLSGLMSSVVGTLDVAGQ